MIESRATRWRWLASMWALARRRLKILPMYLPRLFSNT